MPYFAVYRGRIMYADRKQPFFMTNLLHTDVYILCPSRRYSYQNSDYGKLKLQEAFFVIWANSRLESI